VKEKENDERVGCSEASRNGFVYLSFLNLEKGERKRE
jgi:hypothetical protein